jgi:hypothetical protein
MLESLLESGKLHFSLEHYSVNIPCNTGVALVNLSYAFTCSRLYKSEKIAVRAISLPWESPFARADLPANFFTC